MDDKDYVPVRDRQKDAFGKRLDEALKQYSVVRVGNANGAIHGKDYREMRKLIMLTFFQED